MVRIILIRHGETTWNVEGRYQGQEDTPLSPTGIAQGKAAGLALKDISIDAAVSGPLSRAFDTCRFITKYHHVNIRIDERITEISHGRWEGVHADEIKKNYPKEFELWHNRPEKVQMPGGESLEDVRKRVRAAFDDYAAIYQGKTLLVAAHDAVNKVILCDLMGLGMEHFWHFKQDNACINVIEEHEKSWRLVTLNATTHLGYLFSGIDQKGL